MSATFRCPHCEKQYPNTASLIGRKVRCSSCKNVFQLQGDGTAIKIELLVKKAVPASPADRDVSQASRTASVAQELTRRQKHQVKKGITKRLEKNRNALRDAAKEAVAQVGDEQERAKVERQKESSNRQPSAVNIHLSGTAHKTSGKPVLLIVSAFVACLAVLCFLLVEDSPERVALDAFADTIEDEYFAYPLRLDGYRQRMWLYSRDGVTLPPLIVNADSADLHEPIAVNWSELVAVSQEHLGGMSLMRQFGIWVNSDRQAMVEQLWEDYQQKYDFPSFLNLMRKKNVNFMHCSEFPGILAERGFSELSIYVASLLLAGTRDAAGVECRDYGLISSLTADTVQFHLFNGDRSMELVENGTEYSIAMSGPFCGIVVGFMDILGEPNEWRVLDLRFGYTMNDFLGEKHNPLLALTRSARKELQQAYKNEDLNAARAGEEGQAFGAEGLSSGQGQP